MISGLIDWCLRNRAMVLLLTLFLVAAGVYSAMTIKVDAIPDLSDVQVIVYTNWEGKGPQLVEDQVTYPMTKAMLAVPRSKVVRGYSMFGASFVYIIFEDGTDLYWARSRVLERLASVKLPAGVTPQIGPDATGVGWVYEYVLTTGQYCPEHPSGLWHDPQTDKWYESPDKAPSDAAAQKRLIHHRVFPETRHAWWDPQQKTNYTRREDAPADARGRLVEMETTKGYDRCPLDGKPLHPNTQSLANLRSLQDWYLRYELTAVDGVSEVASVGGFEKQYQVVVDPVKLQAYNIPLAKIQMAVEKSNANVGGRVIEVSEREYMVQGVGYLGTLSDAELSAARAAGKSVEEVRSQKVMDDLRKVAVGTGPGGVAIHLDDVADIRMGPEMRRGLVDWNGQGEAVGGVVVMRFGENARTTIDGVRKKLAEAQKGLPPGVAIETGYDRSDLIDRAVKTLTSTLLEEVTVVALVCILFLLHARSELVAVFVVPTGVLCSLIVMKLLDINANIMSLGGIAIAIGVMVDSSIVMVENSHKHLDREEERLHALAAAGLPLTPRPRVEIIAEAAKEVGPSLFFALMILTVSFLPVFVLGEQSGRLFKPLAYTKTFAMASSSFLAITVIPVLMSLLITARVLPRRWGWKANLLITLAAMFGPAMAILYMPLPQYGEYRHWLALAWVVLTGMLLVPQKIIHENANPLSWLQQRIYEPLFILAMRFRGLVVVLAVAAVASVAIPLSQLGSEFMPPLEEGDLLYMPTTEPGLSMTKARELLQQTDKLLMQFPEIQSVMGKAGRAESATDPAPASMFETTITLHRDKSKWRQVPNESFAFLPAGRYWIGGGVILLALLALMYLRHLNSPRAGWMVGTVLAAAGVALVVQLPSRFIDTTRPITKNELVSGYNMPDGTHVPGLNEVLQIPGLTNSWTMPIQTRIDMLSTGIKTPVGIKVMGPDLGVLSDLADRVAQVIKTDIRTGPHTTSVFAEKTLGGSYLDVTPNRDEIARYGLSVGEVLDVVATAQGGMMAATTVEGLERYSVLIRYPQELRDNLEALKQTMVSTMSGMAAAQVPLGQLATFEICKGPDMIRSDNARRSSWVYVDISDIDVGTYVADAQKAVDASVQLPSGYSIVWSGQYEYMLAARQRLSIAIPLAGVIIVLLLYLSTRSWLRVWIVLLAVPFSLVGAFWLLYIYGFNLSLAVWVGMIALAGLDAETGIVMLLYLDNSFERFKQQGRMRNFGDLWHAVHDGAVKRIRPKTMTVATAMIGLVPLLWATGAGADTMRRLAAPMIGGLVTSFIMELLIYPVIFSTAKEFQELTGLGEGAVFAILLFTGPVGLLGMLAYCAIQRKRGRSSEFRVLSSETKA